MDKWRISLLHALRRARPVSQRAVRTTLSRLDMSRRGGRMREPGEMAVGFLGVALAVASTGFAAYMIADTERQPQFAGLEHLTIFSKPSLSAAHRSRTPTRIAGDQRNEIDYAPVGSIAEARKVKIVPGFLLLGVRAESAVIQTPSTILRVSRGDVVEGLGRIVAVERRGDKWVVVTPEGIVVGN